MKIIDANSAVANVAYKLNELIAIYPITPSSPMAEECETWSSKKKKNLFGDIPNVIEMQSESGAIATVHGGLMTGALATSFTSSQGLLLMIPSLYKLAGELTPFVLHVAARSVATHSLSIFADHSDVMAVRQTGCAMLCASNVQEAQDFAFISTVTSLKTRLPFIHFFDGFKTSHEITSIDPLLDAEMMAMYPKGALSSHRSRALSPDRPSIRGTSSNPDTFFQAREASNPFYLDCPSILQDTMSAFASQTGRSYKLVEYYGHFSAQDVIIAMGSAIGTIKETIDRLLSQNKKVGVVIIRLFRPFPSEFLLNEIPSSVKNIAVLDRTKEPGSQGEPLYLDVIAALYESFALGKKKVMPNVIAARYGLASKEFTPSHVKGIFDELSKEKKHQKRRFSVGINDDVTHQSLCYPPFDITYKGRTNILMYGFGSDGTVSAAKSTLKIIGHQRDIHVKGNFEYDSKKAGGITASHLRLDTSPIHSTYLIDSAEIISLSRLEFAQSINIDNQLTIHGKLIINTAFTQNTLWHYLPETLQKTIIQNKITVYSIDASNIAKKYNLGLKVNTVMQTALFSLINNINHDQATKTLILTIRKRFSNKGEDVIKRNISAINETSSALIKNDFLGMPIGIKSRTTTSMPNAPDSFNNINAKILAGEGNNLPVSIFPPDGVWPTNTAKYEKRNIAESLPFWREDLCTQCGLCVIVCPHAAIRAKTIDECDPQKIENGLKIVAAKSRDKKGKYYSLQVSPDDCTGCELCSKVCPAKDRADKNVKSLMMVDKSLTYDDEKGRFEVFNTLPCESIYQQSRIDVKSLQTVEPLFEYPSACSGCGETAYIKVLTQLYGDRLLIANATGCSSIFGGNLPTTPYATNDQGKGPAWANSLFEDNAEFGLGFKLSIDIQKDKATRLLTKSERLSVHLPSQVQMAINQFAPTGNKVSIAQQREAIEQIKTWIDHHDEQNSHQELLDVIDTLVEKTVWIVGGDGWAYDIGYGGLDHVLRSGKNVNVLVLDTQCYANTGGQKSKATPLGATAKLCSQPNLLPAKQLSTQYTNHKNIFVAQIALGANMNQTIKALKEAADYNGPSLVVAYSPCIEHGYDLKHSIKHTKLVEKTGLWPIFTIKPETTQESAATNSPEKVKLVENEQRYFMFKQNKNIT
ncbi:pyruvate:ferredoxin (flavodoxin) oxidoreductase [Photobacterium profundum]|uniref:Pyruvate-flavodoxin oxidoreductase n=1 Tax=Photobacterium profundum 3TCK TaxID=314280 RepID=Q1Z631_9GAMM|nr:pyruvate:ferredoxin (flavodoxin) oxidoreductase [Photobacterium profundum]EAS44013.1 putative pyruvate-flavodoxin oxidoreductase [Photobacterium profundum 3TCK]PSV61796.1 pyruvate:ferredoxin (flavodoxin) oxidoreductase [Photobacterium profundum]